MAYSTEVLFLDITYMRYPKHFLKYISFLLLLFMHTYGLAQAPCIQWQKSYGGTQGDGEINGEYQDNSAYAANIHPTRDGGYIISTFTQSDDGDVTGQHGGAGWGGGDFWVIKIDVSGNIQWQKALGGSALDWAFEIKQTADNGYIVIGWTNSATSGDVVNPIANDEGSSGWIIKLDAGGNIQWQRVAGGTGFDHFRDVVETPDGGFIAVGLTVSGDGDLAGLHFPVDENDNEGWIIKFDATGNIVWQRLLGGTNSDNIFTIIPTKDGNYLLCGTTNSIDGSITGNNGGYHSWLLKIDGNGNLIWQKLIGTTADESMMDIKELPNGNIIATGGTYNNTDVVSPSGFDMWVSELDASGNSLWKKVIRRDKYVQFAQGIELDTDGGYILATYEASVDLNYDPEWTINNGIYKLDAAGNVVWFKKLGGSQQDYAASAIAAQDGGYIMASITFSNDGDIAFNHGGADVWVVKLVFEPPPVIVITQPGCGQTTGSVVVTVPVTGYTFAIDDVYQSNNVFNNLQPGIYNIAVKNTATGCISPAVQATINTSAQNSINAAATVTMQPDCTTPTGSIVVDAPTGSNYEYSAGAAYQNSPLFTGLAPGNYSITVKDIVSGCTSAPVSLAINPIPNIPAQPIASVAVQPDCVVNTGTITIAQPTGNHIEYSIGGSFQPQHTFTALPPGNYTVAAKDILSGCISDPLFLTVNDIPAAPAVPQVEVTAQPNCQVSTGTITVLAPAGNNLLYSDGGAYQQVLIFDKLPPGNYNITVKDVLTNCISQPAVLTVNTFSNTVNIPAVTNDNRCGAGIVHLSANGSGSIEWYTDAALTQLVNTGSSYSTFLNATQQYYIIATDGTCKSEAASAIATILPVPPQPNIGNDTAICPGDKLLLNAGNYYAYLWQDNSTGSTYQAAGEGYYSVKVFNSSGCTSVANISITITANCNDIYFPNAFTPGNGGPNNFFYALGNLQLVRKYSLEIYNRYGELVFTSNNPYQKWDGSYKGIMTANNNFVWYARYEYRGMLKLKKGNLLLIR